MLFREVRNIMIDDKIKTLLTLVSVGNYTKTAKILSLTQPAVSNRIKRLEEEYGIKIFYSNKKTLKTTPEGELLVQYARKIQALTDNLKQDIEDYRHSLNSFKVGITTTLGEYLVSQIFAPYCKEHPNARINIITKDIKTIYDILRSYELDWAIVEGNIASSDFTTLLLDTDYLCLAVSPRHRFASRKSVSLHELKKEKLILRTKNTGTRTLFENHLLRHFENIRNFNIMIEIDNITTIKELVASNVGVTIIAHSAIRNEVDSGSLVVVPIDNLNMIREINIVYNNDFQHTEVLKDIRDIYTKSGRTSRFSEPSSKSQISYT